MYLTQKYKLKTWYDFDERIFGAARAFYEKRKLFPTKLAMNEHTYQQICFLISVSPKRECILDDPGGEYIEIGGFQDSDWDSVLQIMTSEQIKDREFILIYDDEPDDDDSNTPVSVPPLELECV